MSSVYRIFIALPLDGEAKGKVKEIISRYKNLQVRWLKPEALHFTLIPPWYADEKEITKTKETLKKIARESKAFHGLLTRVRPGPDPRRPRLLWAEGETPEEFIRLKKALEDNFKKEPEKRAPKLHLTIARFRHEEFKIQLEEKILWKLNFDRIELWESVLKRSGAEYKILASFPLVL